MVISSEILATLDVAEAHLAEYFGVWAIAEQPFRAAFERISQLDLRAHVAHQPPATSHQPPNASEGRGGYQLAGGIAVVNLVGPLMKQVSSLSGGTSTVYARRALRIAVSDPAVNQILVRIDSPGGTVAGTQDLGADIAWAATQKPTWAYIEDLGASAAYWAASQASQVFAGPSSLVGSIGTFLTLYDYSQMAANDGVKVHVLRAGEFKGAATPGTEITAEQLAEFQRIVNDLNGHFLKAVSQGRKLTSQQVRELADGRIHSAADAKTMGLIDGVQSLDATLQKLSKQKGPRAMTDPQPSSNQLPVAQLVSTLQPGPASYHELVQACPGADAAFLTSQLAANATAQQAAGAFLKSLSDRLAKAEAENVELKQQLAEAQAQLAAKPTKPGVPPVASSAAPEHGDPVAEWNAAVQEQVKSGKSRAQAVGHLVRTNPDLHRAFVAAANAR